ncbi:MAG: NUDIX domain-containing protein [Chlorobi bacterium]|nr:NUDIX domain-containing protein [Chlorobiota bacterium]
MSKVTLRVSAICVHDDRVLLVEHKSFAPEDPALPDRYWILPGGGVEHGETLDEALAREMKEETGFDCRVGPLLFIKELLYPFPGSGEPGSRHHSVSLGFSCSVTGGELITGKDPEYGDDQQMIIQVRWIPFRELHEFELYPPFLKQYLYDRRETGFTEGVPELFDSWQ